MVWLVVWHFWYEWYVCIFCLWCRCTSVPSVSGPVLFSTTTAPLSSESRSSPAIPCRVKLIKIRVKYRHASTQRKEQNFDVFGGYHTTTPKFQLLKANLWHPNTIISMLNSPILKSIFIAKIKIRMTFGKFSSTNFRKYKKSKFSKKVSSLRKGYHKNLKSNSAWNS